jgi:phospholipid/cholesterol/gamma-HCH transport system substrate-binding protein
MDWTKRWSRDNLVAARNLHMRKAIWIGVAILLALAAIVSIPFAKRSRRGVQVQAYFQNVAGLQVGAPVRIAGVEVGRVTAIRVRPELRDNPAEVSISLDRSHMLDIPSDSVASLSTEGVLGPAFVDIDIRNASGPPLQNGAVLKTVSVENLTPKQFLDRLSEIVQQKQHEGGKH